MLFQEELSGSGVSLTSITNIDAKIRRNYINIYVLHTYDKLIHLFLPNTRFFFPFLIRSLTDCITYVNILLPKRSLIVSFCYSTVFKLPKKIALLPSIGTTCQFIYTTTELHLGGGRERLLSLHVLRSYMVIRIKYKTVSEDIEERVHSCHVSLLLFNDVMIAILMCSFFHRPPFSSFSFREGILAF